MTTDPIKALVDLKALAEAATPGPWAYEAHGDTMTYGVGVLIDPCGDDDDQCAGEQITGVMIVSEAVAVEVQGQANAAFIAAANPKTILAAIEVLKPMADMVMVPREPTPEMIKAGLEVKWLPDVKFGPRVADIYKAMLAAAPPASPAPVDGELVRAAKIEAFDEALSIAEGSYSYGEQQNEIIAGIRAALAAINGEK